MNPNPRYTNLSVLPETLEKLNELKRLNGLPHVRQIDNLVTEKLKTARRQSARQEGAAA